MRFTRHPNGFAKSHEVAQSDAGSFSDGSEARGRRYGVWAGKPGGVAENPKRCIATIHDKWHPGGCQCSRPRGHGTDGLYCKQHDPAAVDAKKAAREAAWKAKWAEGELRRQKIVAGAESIQAIRLIAAGHNDPRALATELLAKYPALSSDSSHV